MAIFRLPKAIDKQNETVKVHNTTDDLLEVVSNNQATLNGGCSSGTFVNSFDGDINTKWTATSETSFVYNQLATLIKIKSIAIYCDGSDGSPTSFTIEGSMDNSSYDILETVENEHWTIDANITAGWREYKLSTIGNYTYYRINISETKNHGNAHISLIELYSDVINESGRLPIFKNECSELLSNGNEWIILHNNPSAWKKIYSETKTETDLSTDYFNIPINGYDSEYKIVVNGVQINVDGICQLNLIYNNEGGNHYQICRMEVSNNSVTGNSLVTNSAMYGYLDNEYPINITAILHNSLDLYKMTKSEYSGYYNNVNYNNNLTTTWFKKTDIIRNIQLKTVESVNSTLTVEIFKRN